MTGSTSTAAHPDLDWSQARETVLRLGLAIDQKRKPQVKNAAIDVELF